MLVVMGVSGSGKTTVAAQLAGRLGATFTDGDDLHPPENVAKMRSGTPLTDGDRWPWLDRVADALVTGAAGGQGIVIACSALRRAYRDRLRAGAGEQLRFLFLDAPFDVIDARMKARHGHFMPEALLRSQFDTLERPAAGEMDVLTVSAAQTPAEIMQEIATRLPAFAREAHS